MPTAGQQDARELHAHLEASDEDVAAAREDVVERSEGRPPERHEQRDDPDHDKGAAGGECAPACDADAEADGQRGS